MNGSTLIHELNEKKMYLCSWLINSTQCTNRTDHLVCEQCEEEKSRLYHEYKEVEKTVISAINDALPRGDLLEASKVITRINRVLKLRHKFTSRLAPQSRDIGDEYHISKLLEKLSQYYSYISGYITSKYATDANKEESHTTDAEYHQCCEYQQSMTSVIQTAIESDPFADYDVVIQQYQKDKQDYEKFVQNMETLTGYREKTLDTIITFIATLRDSLDTTIRYLSRMMKEQYTIEYTFTTTKHEITRLSHPDRIAYMESIIESRLLSYRNIVDWVAVHVKDSARICCRFINFNGKKCLSTFFRVGKVYCPTFFTMTVRIVPDGECDTFLLPATMTPEVLNQVSQEKNLIYHHRK